MAKHGPGAVPGPFKPSSRILLGATCPRKIRDSGKMNNK